MKTKICVVSLLVLAMVKLASAQTIAIETQSPHFFDNVVLDSLLLMDRELQKVLAPDINQLVEKATFLPQANSWIPKPHPKGVLQNIYNNITPKNLFDSFTSMVSQVVEMSCRSKQYDPLSTSSSKCVAKILKYPIIEPIQLEYNYGPGRNFEQLVSRLQNSAESDRYQNIISTLADLMNSGYEKSVHIRITKQMDIVKYPLPMVAATSSPIGGRGGGTAEIDVKNEKMWLEMELDRKRMECTDVSHKQYQRQACDKALKELRNQMELLKADPAGYVAYKQQLAARELVQGSRRQSVVSASDNYTNNNSVNRPINAQEQQYFLTNGGMMTQSPGSSFATTSKGDTYFKPEGSVFSYGTGANSGKTCFHYGAFADCK